MKKYIFHLIHFLFHIGLYYTVTVHYFTTTVTNKSDMFFILTAHQEYKAKRKYKNILFIIPLLRSYVSSSRTFSLREFHIFSEYLPIIQKLNAKIAKNIALCNCSNTQ